MPEQLQVFEQLLDPETLKQGGRFDLFIDPSGVEWQLFGFCGGPKILMPEGVSFLEDSPGGKLTAGMVKWLTRDRGRSRGDHISDEAFAEILKEPESVKQWQPKDLDAETITLEKLKNLRAGCRATFYIPTQHLSIVEKGLRCRVCLSIATFKGPIPKESKYA